MTSIAFDGKILAVDSRVTAGYIVTDNAIKLKCLKGYDIRIHNDRILAIAMAGRMNLMAGYVEALKTGTVYELGAQDADFGGLIVGENYLYEFEDTSPHYCVYSLNEQIATGSGGIFAKSAMSLGHGAVDAIKHAITLDPFSGGLVRWLSPFEGGEL